MPATAQRVVPGAAPKSLPTVHGGSSLVSASVQRGRTLQLAKAPSTAPNLSATPSTSDVLKDLKGTLEKQHGASEELDAKVDPNLVTEQEHTATTQVQLVRKALSAAPDSKVRDLCAMVACQQVEQEVFLRTLRANMDVLQTHVQQISQASSHNQNSDSEHINAELPTTEELDKLLKSSLDTETKKLWFRIEDKIFQQETELMSWLANFCASTVAETLGVEVQRQAEAINSLEMQVNELKEISQQSLEAWQQLLAENPERTDKDDPQNDSSVLPTSAMPQAAPAPADFKKKINGLFSEEASPTTFESTTVIDHKWVQRLYQHVLASTSVIRGESTSSCGSRPSNASESWSTNASNSHSRPENDSFSDA